MNRGAHGAQHAPPPHHMPHQGLGGVHGGFPIGTMPPPMGHQVAYMPPHMNAQGGYGAQYMPGAGYHRHPRMSTQQGHRQMPPYAYAPGMGMRPLAVTSVRLNGDVRQGNVRGVNVRTDSAQGKSFQKKGSHPNAHNPSGYTTVKSPGSEAATTTTTKKKKKKEKKEAALNGAEAAAPGGKPPNAGTSPSDAPKPVKDHKKQTVAETATDEPGEASPAQDATATPSSIPEKNDDQNRKFGASSSAGETSGSGVDNFPPLPGEKQADGQSPADTAPPAASAPIAAATQMASEGSQKNAAVVDDDIPLFFGSISFGSEGTTSSDNSAAVDKPAPAKPPPESSSGGDDEIPVTISFGAEGSIVAGESGVSTTAPDTQNSESSTVSSPQRRPVGYAAALLNGSSGSSSPSGNKVRILFFSVNRLRHCGLPKISFFLVVLSSPMACDVVSPQRLQLRRQKAPLRQRHRLLQHLQLHRQHLRFEPVITLYVPSFSANILCSMFLLCSLFLQQHGRGSARSLR